MKRFRSILASLAVILLLTSVIQQDDLIETLKKKIYEYTYENPSTLLYLHLDKNNYSAGEDIWFKAYVLSGTVTDNKVLNVRLLNKDKKIIISEQFPTYDLRAHGDLALPDSLQEGDYTLFAYTDRMINFSEKDIFTQLIKVSSGSAKILQAEASVVDTAKLKRGEEVEVKVILRNDGVPVGRAKGEYRLFAGGKFIKGAKLRTNDFGETSINFIYPKLPDDQGLKLSAKFTRDKDYANLSLNLRHEGNPIYLSVFPEGGHLIEGINNNMAVQSLDINGYPVSTEVLVKNGEQLITKVKTNEQGIGTFSLIPKTATAYNLELTENKKSISSGFQKAESKGYGLKVSRKEDQSMQAIVYSKEETGTALLVLRSYEEILWSKAVTIPKGDSLIVSLPADFPKDVLSLTIFDQGGVPKAERLFLNRLEEDYKVNIQTDQQVYGSKKKVTVTITATDKTGKPIEANLSVAAVEKGRIDLSSYQTILHSFQNRFLKGSNSGLMVPKVVANQMNDLLITKKWCTGQWPEIISYSPKGSLTLIRNADGVNGIVEAKQGRKIYVKELDKFVGASIFTVPLDEKGTFSIASSKLLTTRAIPWRFLPKDARLFKSQYVIRYHNEDLNFDKRVILESSLIIPETFNILTKTQLQAIPQGGDMIQLQEVVIKSKEEGVGAQDYWSKDCNDWICRNSILNCPMHPSTDFETTEPVQGFTYGMIVNHMLIRVVYHGCANGRDPSLIKSIFIPRNFPQTDYEKNPTESARFRSTIYWNPNIDTDQNGKATFSFFTSDIKGDFLIMVQGIDGDTVRPVYGAGGFTVK